VALDSSRVIQIQKLDSTVISLRLALDRLQNKVIPGFESEIQILEAIDLERIEKAEIADQLNKIAIAAARSKRITIGPAVGWGFNSTGESGPIFGVVINYAVFRF
tara:strand:+ start:21537 stop:21851 length:315 start_codon:yes stop_codon:yes gene_type:complete